MKPGPGPVPGGRLVRAGIQAPVDLPGICDDDLSVERPGELDGNPGLPDAGRPEDGDDARKPVCAQ
jgi:hypothetical protein